MQFNIQNFSWNKTLLKNFTYHRFFPQSFLVVGYLDQSLTYAVSTVRNGENFGFLQKRNFSSQSNLKLLHACACQIGYYQWVKDSSEHHISVPFSLPHFQCSDPKRMNSEKNRWLWNTTKVLPIMSSSSQHAIHI